MNVKGLTSFLMILSPL